MRECAVIQWRKLIQLKISPDRWNPRAMPGRAFFSCPTDLLSRARRRSSFRFSASNLRDKIEWISSRKLQSSSADIDPRFLFFTFASPLALRFLQPGLAHPTPEHREDMRRQTYGPLTRSRLLRVQYLTILRQVPSGHGLKTVWSPPPPRNEKAARRRLGDLIRRPSTLALTSDDTRNARGTLRNAG
jgi:hypothetical protein